MGVPTSTSRLRPTAAARWRARGRLLAALFASVALHWFLQQGLARTVLGLRPLDGLFPDPEPSFRPELATDFPLRDDTSRRERFAHEQPLEVPLAIDAAAPASARGAPREDERLVEPVLPADGPEAPAVSAAVPRPELSMPPADTGPTPPPERQGLTAGAAELAAETIDDVAGLERSGVDPAPARRRRGAASVSDRRMSDRLDGADRAADGGAGSLPPAASAAEMLARVGEARGGSPSVIERATVTAADGDAENVPAIAGVDAPGTPPVGATVADTMAGSSMDLPIRPTRRAPLAGGRKAGIGRPPPAAGDDPAEESLSVPAPTVGVRTPAAVGVGGTTAVGPALTSTPLPRSRTLVLPAETRVRETAEAFARRARVDRGAAEADAMVERGLEWLARTQQSDGRWSLGRYDPSGSPGTVRLQSDTAATGLALLSFLGAGYDHFDGRHRDVVRRGLEWLVAVQKEDGDLYLPADPVSNSCAWMYSHGIATTALCEAVGMTGDPLLRPAAEKAIGFVVASQQPQRGGWRYQPRADSDLSVSGWMLVAVRSGELAGLRVPEQTLAGIGTLLEESTAAGRPGQYLYNSRNPGQRPSDFSAACMTALGTLMRLHTGTPRDADAVRAAAANLAAIRPSWGSRDRKARDAYLWYYSSQVLVQTGGAEWEAWYRQLCTLLESKQIAAGSDAGSWDPLGPLPDRWGPFGGRVYVTALHLLALEVPYRHLPTYGVTDAAGR